MQPANESDIAARLAALEARVQQPGGRRFPSIRSSRIGRLSVIDRLKSPFSELQNPPPY
jgi:hypothetical protein